jgi:hypothetical protein
MITQIARKSQASFPYSAAVCAILHIASWLIFIPYCIKLTDRFSVSAQIEKSVPTPFYFRPGSGGLFYFSRVTALQSASGVFIDLANVQSNKNIRNNIFNDVPLARIGESSGDPSPYSDVLVRDTMTVSGAVGKVGAYFLQLNTFSDTAYNEGRLAWCSFASICLPMLALLAFARLPGWKLINLLFLLLGFFAIIMLNAYFYSHDVSELLALPVFRIVSQTLRIYLAAAAFNILIAVCIVISTFFMRSGYSTISPKEPE